MIKAILIIIFALFLTGCIQHVKIEGSDHKESHWNIGITKIGMAQYKPHVKNLEITTLGAWFDKSNIGVGFKSDQEIVLSEKCKVVFIIENEKQLKKSIQLINQELNSNKENICVL
ncbi:MAG: hypothetical protein KDI92_00245 [Xanthomonadales bacterium]|nr:hypothetical protein [Xanthomonadales bacterium]